MTTLQGEKLVTVPTLRLAIQTLLLPGDDLTEKFAAAAHAGFDGVEVAVGPAFDLASHLYEVHAACEASGLPVCAICTHPIHDPLVPDTAERKKRFAGLTQLVALADELGATGVVSVPLRPPHTFPDLSTEALAALAVDEFGAWAATLPAGQAAVFLEPLNRYEAFFLNRVGQASDLARRINQPRVKALADLFHMNIEEADLGDPIHQADGQLGHVHIADNNRLEPGAGCLDFATPFAALKAIDYQGFVSIECFSPGGPRLSGDPASVLPATARFVRAAWAAA